MNNAEMVYQNFELEKNKKAALYTVIICAGIFLVFFFLKWSLPQIPQPATDTGIEVNLGNSETGLGDVAPQMQGNPSVEQDTKLATPPPSKQIQSTPDVLANEVTGENDEAVGTLEKKVNPKKPLNHNPTVIHPKTNDNNVIKPTPAPPKPKALFQGGTSTTSSGNGADSYNGVFNQGIAGGKGDQGKPNGNPNSDSYTGNGGTGTSGVSIRNGLTGRLFTKLPSFEDDFNEPAKVAVDITVNKLGEVIQASINPRGTTTTNQNIRNIALRKAKLLKLNAGDVDNQTGTIVFSFKLNG
ncbi:hypothetical protein [Hydrotalea sandarakina]|jgi:hypothetical protein|uniref:Outer membrane transport energization protein TonB n=1 Tax=Hydrotalea sandarakina TaxID=1004304 RepID=A0A2W7RYS2_9BACT|nr:hypothetical protein [Hydrotalea sandarakina]PZX65651.1 hypothetical protein LX80_00140 [Hydrotalea sandarakina]